MARMTKHTELHNARLSWQEDGAPYSPDYDDVYFSREGGLAETHYVFLQANDLLARWQALDAELVASDRQAVFTIAELGFGTGLNFLSCWRLWQQSGCQRLRLHYISCEKHPLTHEALGKALLQWPELARWRDQLLLFYPDHTAGYHRLPLPDVTLDLYYGDALELLKQQSSPGAKVDAWFLDGFTPAHNPELWSDEILATIAALSHGGSTLSSYSVTGRVVRELRALGFEVEKRKGFGHKRQMLFARFGSEFREEVRTPRSAVVIGAGLAGAMLARSLARRGVHVSVLEQLPEVAGGASGNRQAVVQMRLNRQADALWQLNLHSYLYALRCYQALADESGNALDWHACGVLTLDSAYTHTRKGSSSQDYSHYPDSVLQQLSSEMTGAVSGIQLQEAGIYLPGGGWLNPAACCRLCLEHPLINVKTNVTVARLERDDSGQWQLSEPDGRLITRGELVFIANSYAATDLAPTENLPLAPLRGQVSHVPSTSDSESINLVLCSERYLAPANQGLHCVGASYVKNTDDAQLSLSEHEENLQKLGTIGISLQLDQHSPLAGRVGFRGTSRDYLPMAGAVPDPEQPAHRYGGAQHFHDTPEETRLPGLYISAGHGSHGTVSCPILAEHLASLACGEPSPLPQPLTELVDPIRFQRRGRRRSTSPEL